MGRYEFSLALDKGSRLFEENFDENGKPKVKDAQIIDVQLSRQLGIYPME